MHFALGTKAIIVATCLAGLTVFLLFVRPVKNSKSSGEPPEATTGVPIIGHVIGLLTHRVSYYTQLRYVPISLCPVAHAEAFQLTISQSNSQQTRSSMYMMTMPGQKIYVVMSPELIQAVQKQLKALAFPPLEAKFASRICDSSPQGQRIITESVAHHDSGLSVESYEAMRSALKPGVALDEMNRVMISNIGVIRRLGLCSGPQPRAFAIRLAKANCH